MAYTIIGLPGIHCAVNGTEADGTEWENVPFESIEIRGGIDEPVSLTITVSHYDGINGGQTRYFMLRFDDVLEYRFINDNVYYEDIAAHHDDFLFGLIEILDSAYVENMASKGSGREFPVGQRFGKYDDDPNSGGIPEAEVRHFRFAQDDWENWISSLYACPSSRPIADKANTNLGG